MRTVQKFAMALAAALVCLTMTGCPDGGALGTFDLYIINATASETIGLVGLDNHQSKDLVDVLDENIPAGSMKVIKVNKAIYGDDAGSVQIGIVNVGFTSIDDVALGPDPAVILVRDGTNSVQLFSLDYL